jgi:hypothetical protein
MAIVYLPPPPYMPSSRQFSESHYLLPARNISEYNNNPRLPGYKKYLSSKGVTIANDVVGNTPEWVAEWLSTGKVPAKATRQIWMGEFKFWNY